MEQSVTRHCPVRHWARAAPRRAALKFDGRWWTYQQLDCEVGRWAALLRSRDVGAGSRIALLSGNRPEFVFLAHAVARVGAAIAPLNARLTHSELKPLVERLSPALVIAEERLRDRILGTLSLESLVEEAAGLGARGSDAAEHDCHRADRLFAILFTSGTTGQPKGVELTVDNFAASANASAENLGGSADQRWLACLPFFHVGGLAMLTRAAWYGAALVIHSRFEPDAVIASMRADGITHLSLVENALEQTLSASAERRFPPKLQAALIGGGSVSVNLLQRARRAGLPALQTYGLTEATSQVTTERVDQADGETAGPPLQGLSVRIAARNGAAALAPGEVGEVEVRGPTVMRAYWSDADSTSQALRDGWLHTGDVGALDDRGRLTVFARRSDLIISGGENVYPAEVEHVLAEHPNVADIAVLSRVDSRWGQVPVAAVVPRGEAPIAADLERWSRSRLAPFKVPTRWLLFQVLPRSATGKIDRLAVRDLIDRALREEIAGEP
jgi:o-succinylbenzoate---CoA ligase